MKKTQNQLNVERMEERMGEINKISPTMCSAKWLQSTILLQNGHGHSCHHPATHKIPLEEIKNNPSALHNTKYKKQQRKMMLEGVRPPECQYCWNIEDLPGDHYSDRTYKSTDMEWSMPYIDDVLQAKDEDDINPTYLEVAFENTCNLKCVYCSPDISSKWMEEIKQFGAYPTSTKTGNIDWLKHTGKMPIPNKDDNPYIDAFWDWWPELYKTLNTFRITGGEPLLSKNLWKLLEEIKNNPRKDFTLSINTNMDVPEQLIEKFIKYYNDIAPNIKNFEVFTSCEATGEQANYIRYGLNYERFMNNVKKFLNETNNESRINFMITFNLLSVTTFEDFLKDIWNLRVEFNEDDSLNRIPIMISYLRWPTFLTMGLLTDDIKEMYITKYKNYVQAHTRATSNNKAGRFYIEELDQIDRLCEFMLKPSENTYRNKLDFVAFIDECDKRRNLDFDNVFPELVEFKKGCNHGR